jgi:mono/diheme cytochrome c family protein
MMRTIRRVILSATLFAVADSMSMSMPVGFAVEPSRPAQKSTGKRPGDAEQGRGIFNGKGICFYCHGIDADPGQLPQLAPDTSRMIATLNPKPANLRAASRLGLKTDQERARIIRQGHSGTAMLPDTGLSDEEIHDLVAYLASLQPAGFQKQ